MPGVWSALLGRLFSPPDKNNNFRLYIVIIVLLKLCRNREGFSVFWKVAKVEGSRYPTDKENRGLKSESQ